MCGIVGYVGHRQAWPVILAGLKNLEYRGYDSAGAAILSPSHQLHIHKSAGKVKELDPPSDVDSFAKGHLGVGHTRWATHGKPTDANAHPHTDCRGQVAVVHNGIVENYLELKRGLQDEGHTFTSETDTEVIAHLIERGLDGGRSFEDAFLAMSGELQGSQAIVAIRQEEKPHRLLAIRLGNAGGIVVAHKSGETMVSSDLTPMLSFAESVSFLEDGEAAIASGGGVKFVSAGGRVVDKSPQPIPQISSWVDKEGYKHFMLKEIMEQPRVVANALSGRVSFERGEVTLEEFPLSKADTQELKRVVLIGMGTSLHAAMIGKHLVEDLAGIAAEVDNASEFRYRNFHVDDKTLVVSVGQSGETADTLAAMAAAREKGARLMTVCNVEGSQATRLAEAAFYTRCGPEIGVASTKTFVASTVVLCLISTYLGQMNGALEGTKSRHVVGELARLPHLLGNILADHQFYERLARLLYKYEHFLFLGRGLTFPIAMEGALKLKEISYIHAEGYAAGEMKHGPIALIDPHMPVVVVAPDGPLYGKTLNNIKEVKARDGVVIAIATEGNMELASEVDEILYIPQCSDLLTPMLTAVPLQLLSYYVAVRRGCDVDQPRNLAKSVTVE